MQARAKIGGEVGTNGEFYEGGKFLPSTERPKRTGRSKGTGKREIEPYVWVVAPSENHRSIFRAIAGVFGRYDDLTKTLVFAASDQTLAFYAANVAKIHDLIARFNAGERWCTREELP